MKWMDYVHVFYIWYDMDTSFNSAEINLRLLLISSIFYNSLTDFIYGNIWLELVDFFINTNGWCSNMLNIGYSYKLFLDYQAIIIHSSNSVQTQTPTISPHFIDNIHNEHIESNEWYIYIVIYFYQK